MKLQQQTSDTTLFALISHCPFLQKTFYQGKTSKSQEKVAYKAL